jgi:proteasome assembly chaperone (PAC2) family protein
MWERLEVDETLPVEDSVLLVALSTMVPQYRELYSHAKEFARFLLRKVEFRKFASLYSSSLPPEVGIEDDGLARLRSNQFYSHAGKRRIILLAGDGSPFDDQPQYAHSVLSFARQLGAKELISIGARWSESPIPPGALLKPVGFATDVAGVKELEGLGVTITKSEPGPFFPNLIVGMAEGYGMRGYKLGVDHGEPMPHPKSLIQITGVVSKMLGLDIDLKELVARAKDLDRVKPQEGLPEVARERSGIYG